AAARALATLTRPPTPRRTSAPRHVKVDIVGPTRRSLASANEYGTIGTGADSRSTRPWASSALTTARAARAGSKSRAFAAKYSSIVSWKSRWSWLRLVKTATENH